MFGKPYALEVMNGWIPKNHGGLEPMIFHPQLASPFPPRGKTASFNKALVRGSWCFKMHQIIGLDISWGFAWGPFFSRIKMSWNSWPMGARRKAHLVANNPKNKDGNEKLCKSWKYRGKCRCTLQPLNFNEMHVGKILQAREWPWVFSDL